MSFELKLIIFLLASVYIVWVSRASLKNIRSHGFYRFLAWECMLILIIENIPFWFKNPLSIQQIFSWITLFASLGILFWGLQSLRNAKRSPVERSDSSLYEFEQTTELVTGGLYKYIRHPMYSSLLFLAIGAFLKNLSFLSIVLVVMSVFFLFVTAVVEERENLSYFGDAYQSFMKNTKRFIPFLY